MTLKLFYQTYSPPCRAVLAVLTLLNIPHELIIIDLANKDQFKPEILKMNPQHTIPILKDNETIVIDSHVINAYLVENYAKDENRKLYPKDLAARALVDHKLHYDTGVLFPAYRSVKRAYVPYKSITGITPEIIKDFEEIYSTVERFLKGTKTYYVENNDTMSAASMEHFMKGYKYITGDDVTIADISFYVSLTTMAIIWPPKELKFPLVVTYIKRCETDIPSLKSINDPGLEAWKKVMEGFKYTL